MEVTTRFLELLLAGASREDLDAVVAEAEAPHHPRRAEAVREQHALALRVHEQMTRQRGREAELSALYETARDLTAIRDLDSILAAIVRRARQLLHADMTYLSLNDEEEGASYMKVTDGALTPEFRTLRLPLGTGLLGLVAQSGAPYFTEDYQADARFLHRDYIDTAVDGEHIRAILGVPLTVEGTVIGALLAVHRTVRPFPPGEVALLTSFAAHAAVALENARLFEQARAAVAAADEASAALLARNRATESAAHAHDLLTDVLLHGGGVVEVAEVLAEVLDGNLTVYDEEGRLLAGPGPEAPRTPWPTARRAGPYVGALRADRRRRLGLRGRRGGGPPRHPGAAHRGADGPARAPHPRARGAGTALVLLFGRSEAEAESRVRGELLADLVTGVPSWTRSDCASAPGSRAPTWRARLAVAVAERRERAGRPAPRGAGPGAARPRRLLRGAGRRAGPGRATGARRALQARLDGATVGVAAVPGARPGSPSVARGPPEPRRPRAPGPGRARSATPPGSGWPGCCSAATAPRSSRSSSR